MKIHDLKIDPQPLADLVSGAKTCEIRNDDRGFEVGDTVRFPGGYSRTISHIQRGYSLPDGLCVLSYAQASAAPEQEPVAYLHQVVCGDAEPDQALSFEADSFPLSEALGYRSLSHAPLYTHADPNVRWQAVASEQMTVIERLRADLDTMRRKNNEYCDELIADRQKLADAQAMLRDCHAEFNTAEASWFEVEMRKKIDAFLSATAQPAEGRKPFDRDGYVMAMREVAKEFARADGTAGKVSKWALGRINATAEVKS